jgi:hypothetical protein
MSSVLDRLSPEARAQFEALSVAEKRIKDKLNTEVWDLIQCVRQHPEITGPVKREEASPAMLVNAIVFAHFAGHARGIARLADLAVTITNELATIESEDAASGSAQTATVPNA